MTIYVKNADGGGLEVSIPPRKATCPSESSTHMSRKLHLIRGKNSFCGPSAIATVLGLTTDHAARVLRAISGDKRVTGV